MDITKDSHLNMKRGLTIKGLKELHRIQDEKKEIMISGHETNPIYVDYYSHTKCDCYKIDLPWTKYNRHTLVLCEVSLGYKRAKKLAQIEIAKHFDLATKCPITHQVPQA
jgi:hypothetical protein